MVIDRGDVPVSREPCGCLSVASAPAAPGSIRTPVWEVPVPSGDGVAPRSIVASCHRAALPCRGTGAFLRLGYLYCASSDKLVTELPVSSSYQVIEMPSGVEMLLSFSDSLFHVFYKLMSSA